MTEQIEIEYKTLLTNTQFAAIKAKYAPGKNAFVQENYYFDTPDFRLKQLQCGLRIRIFEDSAECTLKTPLKEGLLETTDHLSPEHAQTLLQTQTILLHGSVAKKLASLGIQADQVCLFADLKTARIQVNLPIGELALDESWYGKCHDYELELEVTDATKGKVDFLNLLAEFEISYQPAKNKIIRAFEAIV